MIRWAPASTALSITRSVPFTLASYMAACSVLGMPTLYVAPTWNTPSAPVTPSRMAASSERSPSTICAPISRSGPAFDGERTSATTSSPRSRSLRTRCWPMNPVPPVTKAFTRGTLNELQRAAGLHWTVVERGRNGRAAESRYGEGITNPRARQRALCIAVAPEEPDLSELRELLRTAGVAVSGELTQRRASPDPDRY